ncbi:MAG TPA: DNA polymerase III subunit chi [Gammaproteobacteria bacterium]|nr:DNA polymerase III subunit chi [Gammaproteobacteria bacterium]
MPTIDFYMIPAQGDQARLLFACRLLEKAFQQQHQIYVHLGDLSQAQILDNLLWTFKDDSFIPHQIYTENQAHSSPILIGHAKSAPHHDILLNLDNEIPSFHGEFNRILEITINEAAAQEIAQKHRVFYEEKGYKITSHQLTK